MRLLKLILPLAALLLLSCQPPTSNEDTTYEVSYNLNGGSNPGAADSPWVTKAHAAGSSVTVASAPTPPSSMTFVSWELTLPDATMVSKAAGDTFVMPAGNVVLKATYTGGEVKQQPAK